MVGRRCPACGGWVERPNGACPHCGAATPHTPSNLWVLLFFVIGVLLGLGWLLAGEGWRPEWQQAPSATTSQGEPVSVTPARAARPAVQTPATATTEGEEGVARAAISCDRKAAMQVRDKVGRMAMLSEGPQGVVLYMGDEWAYYSAGHRRGLVTAFAEADHCLNGTPRPIRFIFRGEEAATVDATGSITAR